MRGSNRKSVIAGIALIVVIAGLTFGFAAPPDGRCCEGRVHG